MTEYYINNPIPWAAFALSILGIIMSLIWIIFLFKECSRKCMFHPVLCLVFVFLFLFIATTIICFIPSSTHYIEYDTTKVDSIKLSDIEKYEFVDHVDNIYTFKVNEN